MITNHPSYRYTVRPKIPEQQMITNQPTNICLLYRLSVLDY
jgi:hypothetical protein